MPNEDDEFDDSDMPPPDPVYLTKSQAQVYDMLIDYGLLHKNGYALPDGTGLRPRLFPLIAGPTGSGKSFLVERAAHALGAEYVRITYGDWIPQGARDSANATMFRIARLLARHDHLLVHVDEIDKWCASGQEWGRSVSTDLWNLLDGKIPWEQAMAFESDETLIGMLKTTAATDRKSKKGNEGNASVNNFGRTDHMWLVGSGTWQSVFERQSARTIGFQSGSNPVHANEAETIAEAIHASKIIPTELAGRFASDILVLNYPSSAETTRLLALVGIKDLAAEVGIKVSLKDVDYAVSGMRSLESLKTRLLLKKVRKLRQAGRTTPPHKASDYRSINE